MSGERCENCLDPIYQRQEGRKPVFWAHRCRIYDAESKVPADYGEQQGRCERPRKIVITRCVDFGKRCPGFVYGDDYTPCCDLGDWGKDGGDPLRGIDCSPYPDWCPLIGKDITLTLESK